MASYLAGEPVWMGTPQTGNDPKVEDFTIPDSVFAGNNNVRFRFAFQDPSLDPVESPGRSTGPTHWEVQNFTWSTFEFLADNRFGIDLDELVYTDCDGTPGLVFVNPPVSLDSMTFEWFENLQDLYNDQGVFGDETVPFVPATDDERYFVRVSFVHPTTLTPTERIYQLHLINWVGCGPNCLTPREAIERVLLDAAVSWPNQKNIQDCVEIISTICPPVQ